MADDRLIEQNERQERLEQEFGSIPDALQAMQEDRQYLCCFMAFCQERTPIFAILPPKLLAYPETMRTEQITEQRLPLKVLFTGLMHLSYT